MSLLNCNALYSKITSKEPVCPRVELIFKIIIILLIIFLGFIKSKPCLSQTIKVFTKIGQLA